jgi:hypothetical protein
MNLLSGLRVLLTLQGCVPPIRCRPGYWSRVKMGREEDFFICAAGRSFRKCRTKRRRRGHKSPTTRVQGETGLEGDKRGGNVTGKRP